jgi:hypothetical protein
VDVSGAAVKVRENTGGGLERLNAVPSHQRLQKGLGHYAKDKGDVTREPFDPEWRSVRQPSLIGSPPA